MKRRQVLQILFLIPLLLSSAAVVKYYWSTDLLNDIRRVPVLIMIYCLIYVLTQIVKRFVLKSNNWWDWLYYIGLISVMLPTFIASENTLTMFNFITDYGSFFLLIPALFDLKSLLIPSE